MLYAHLSIAFVQVTLELDKQGWWIAK